MYTFLQIVDLWTCITTNIGLGDIGSGRTKWVCMYVIVYYFMVSWSLGLALPVWANIYQSLESVMPGESSKNVHWCINIFIYECKMLWNIMLHYIISYFFMNCHRSLYVTPPLAHSYLLVYRIAVNNCCTELLYITDAQNWCTQLLYTIAVHNCCTWCCADLLYIIVVQTCCAELLCRTVVQNCCTQLLYRADAQNCCTELLYITAE